MTRRELTGGESVLVRVYTGGQDELRGGGGRRREDETSAHNVISSTTTATAPQTYEIQPRFRLGQPAKDLSDLLEISQITPFPLYLDVLDSSLGGGVLDPLDGFVTLILFTVDHDDAAVGEGEGERDLLTDSFSPSGDDGGLQRGVSGVSWVTRAEARKG